MSGSDNEMLSGYKLTKYLEINQIRLIEIVFGHTSTEPPSQYLKMTLDCSAC